MEDNDNCDYVACDCDCVACKEPCACGLPAGGTARRENEWAPTGEPFVDGFSKVGSIGAFEITAAWNRAALCRAAALCREGELRGTLDSWVDGGRLDDAAIDVVIGRLAAMETECAPQWWFTEPVTSLGGGSTCNVPAAVCRFACPVPRCSMFIAVHQGIRNAAFLFDYANGNPSVRFCIPHASSWGVDGRDWVAAETDCAMRFMERFEDGAALRDAALDRFANLNPDAVFAGEAFRRADAVLTEALAKAAPPSERFSAMPMGLISASSDEFWLAWVDVSRVDAAAVGAYVAALPEIVEHQYPKSTLRDFIGRLAAAGRADAISEICKAAPYNIRRKVAACIGLHEPADPHAALAAAMEGAPDEGGEFDNAAANYAAAFAEGYPNAAAGYAALRDADPALFRRVASTEDGFRTMLRLVVAAVAGGREGGPEVIALRRGARRLAAALRDCVVDSPPDAKLLKAHRDDFARMVAEMDEEWLHHPVETAALELLWAVLADAGASFPRPPQYYASVAGWRKDTLEQVEKLGLY